MAIPSFNKPLPNTTDPDVQALLKGIQGNILRGHGRDHAAILVLTFGPSDETGNPTAARAWIRALSASRITSAFEQDKQRDVPGRSATLQTLALSSRGYEYLSLKRPKDGAFRDGLQKRGPILHDPPVEVWEESYQHAPHDVHALLIIANKDRAPIDAEVETVRNELTAFGGRVLVEERGDQQKVGGEGVEHFGYRDGVSQPILIRDPKAPANAEFDQHAPLKLVLSPDPSGPDRFGSYLVYRKLQQNVRGFDAAVAQVAGELGMDPTLLGAMAIGRFKDGTPVVASETPMGNTADEVDFDYGTDKNGRKCPFHAHIRKTNPRGELPFLINLFAREQRRRIARRGITYGARPDLETGGPPPRMGVGLLFMCYQSDIADQFEFIQETWANNPNFRKGDVGLDPVIGQSLHPGEEQRELPNWPTAWDSETKRKLKFGEFVRMLGGEYFFAPSMETLRTM